MREESKRAPKAVILAAGIGSRLRPLTEDCPKSLLSVGGSAILERIIRNCLSSGISQFVLVLGYRDEMRMVQAARLLRQRSMSVAEVGGAVGFSDPAYFSRMFSNHIGMSPRQYQKQR